jgi:hypothetical protein
MSNETCFMRLLPTIAVLLSMAACATRDAWPWQEITTIDTSSPPSLVGRWKSNTAPTGYWIIDRHTDGRFASKFYLCYDTDEPHEIAMEWGRWELDGKQYRHVIDGTNSEVLVRFVGKWKEWPVIGLTHDRFDFEVNDGFRWEKRVSITASLPVLKLPTPTARNSPIMSPYGGTSKKHGVNEPGLKNIPDWVFSEPL